MRDVHKIKITGLKARLGHHGGVRFQVCNPSKKAWVTPSFARSPNRSGDWLLLDQYVYELAQGIYLARPDPEQRIACARLRLTTGCDHADVLEVDDIEALWLEDPPPPVP